MLNCFGEKQKLRLTDKYELSLRSGSTYRVIEREGEIDRLTDSWDHRLRQTDTHTETEQPNNFPLLSIEDRPPIYPHFLS